MRAATLLDRGLPAGLALVGVLAVGLAGRDANPGPPGFRLDDAWIHMVYGRGLLENGFLAYNDGVPSTGCTSPLWAMVLAAVHALFGSSVDGIVRGVVTVGAVLHGAAAISAARLTSEITRDRLASIVAGGLVGLAIPVGAAAISGMEVGLTVLLLLEAVRAVVRRRPGRAGLWAALATLARPEAALVTAVLLLALLRLAPPAERGRVLGRAIIAPAIAAALFAGWNLWASGRPLPSTFYAKSSASLLALPARLGVALGRILPDVPPLAFGLGWIALAGYLPERPAAGSSARDVSRWLPLVAGAAFLLGNLVILDPVDPAAFYHQRYLLPAVPLILVALAIGAHGLSTRLPDRARAAPALALLTLSVVGAATIAGPASRHLHNDIRNINEVQRALGERLARDLPEGSRIAASDAGAIRYFSRLETLDVIGLNTPEMRDPTDEFLSAHPVAALVLMPAWFASPDATLLEVADEATTERYTVTSNPEMARQIVLRARQTTTSSGGTTRVRFAGFHRFVLDFDLPAGKSGAGARAATP